MPRLATPWLPSDPILDPYADELVRTLANGTGSRCAKFPESATFCEPQRTCGMGFDSPQRITGKSGDGETCYSQTTPLAALESHCAG